MKRLLGGLLLAAGILVMTLSGLCTLAVVVSGLASYEDWHTDWTIALVPLLFGGLPFLLGLGMLFAGRSVLRRENARAALDENEARSRFE